MKTSIQEGVGKLANLLKAQYIYVSDILAVATAEAEEEKIPMVLVLLREGDPDLSDEMRTIAGMVFRRQYGILLRIYSLPYAERLIRDGNLFFIHACQPENLVYKHPEQHVPAPGAGLDVKSTLEATQRNFDQEMNTVRAFRDGAAFYNERGDLPQAAFMMHQSIELGFRLAELMIIGKEKICHSIERHLRYVREFIPKLYNVFFFVEGEEEAFEDFEEEEEYDYDDKLNTQLLKLLDGAYKGVRYGKDYRVTEEDMARMLFKSKKQQVALTMLFRSVLEVCKREMTEGVKNKKITIDIPGNFPTSSIDNGKIKKMVKDLVKRKLYRLPRGSERSCERTGFMINGPAEMIYSIGGILKVCILSLECMECNPSGHIPESQVDIQLALEHALQLLPYEEMECLENIMQDLEIGEISAN